MDAQAWDRLADARAALKSAIAALDEVLKDRPALPAPERLGESSVRAIRERHHKGGESVTKLALAYGVSKSTISRAVRFQSHKRA